MSHFNMPMKAYGLPRHKDIEYPDVADIQQYGLASHVGRVKTESKEYKSYTRKAIKRREVRRYWKKLARRFNKSLCKI